MRNGGHVNANVYLLKRCREHGVQKTLISDDIGYWKSQQDWLKPGDRPLNVQTRTDHGCPYDCGLCPDHEQHSCLAILEINEACNLSCPVAAAVAAAGAASAAPNGTFTINNNSSDYVSRAANSFSSSSFPAIINYASSDIGLASTSGTMSGTVIYVNPTTGLGCSFTTLVYLSGSSYSFSLSAAPYGSGSTATCTYTTSYRNTSTGAFSATWNMSGF